MKMGERELRVAIFTGNYNHVADGVALTLHRLVHYLERIGVPVIIFGPTVEEPVLKSIGDFVPIPSVPIPGRPEYRICTGLPEAALKRLQVFGPTLIDVVTPDYLGVRALRYARRNRVPVVATFHTHFVSYMSYYHLDMFETMGWRYLNWFYNQCHHVYVPTESMASELRDHGIIHPIRIWERGVDIGLFTPEKRDREWLATLGILESQPVVSFISRLVWEKDLDTLIKTINRVRSLNSGVRFLIVGDGPARSTLETLLPGVVFTGFLEGEELARAYASSDLFFFPSITETFGNVTLEAMASGLSVVVADATGSSSIVRHGGNGLIIEPRNVNAFADAILNLVADGHQRSRFGRHSWEIAQRYSWNIILEGLLRHYRRAVC